MRAGRQDTCLLMMMMSEGDGDGVRVNGPLRKRGRCLHCRASNAPVRGVPSCNLKAPTLAFELQPPLKGPRLRPTRTRPPRSALLPLGRARPGACPERTRAFGPGPIAESDPGPGLQPATRFRVDARRRRLLWPGRARCEDQATNPPPSPPSPPPLQGPEPMAAVSSGRRRRMSRSGMSCPAVVCRDIVDSRLPRPIPMRTAGRLTPAAAGQ